MRTAMRRKIMRIAPIHRLVPMAFVATLLAPAATRAEDFTFTVPVAVRDLPSYATAGSVRCEALKSVPSAPAGSIGITGSWGETGFKLTHGEFQGNVTVRFNATGMSLAEAKGYRCALYYNDLAGIPKPMSTLDHRTGTTFTAEVHGALNP
jgi:hypothetical protein